MTTGTAHPTLGSGSISMVQQRHNEYFTGRQRTHFACRFISKSDDNSWWQQMQCMGSSSADLFLMLWVWTCCLKSWTSLISSPQWKHFPEITLQCCSLCSARTLEYIHGILNNDWILIAGNGHTGWWRKHFITNRTFMLSCNIVLDFHVIF